MFSGIDPVTGKDVYLTETVKGTDRAAEKAAEKVMTRLLSPGRPAALGDLVRRVWLRA